MLFKKIISLLIFSSIFVFSDDMWHSQPGGIQPVKYNPPPATDENTDPTKCGDPIDMFSGAYLNENRDLYIPGHLPLEITRRYSSQRYYNSPFVVW